MPNLVLAKWGVPTYVLEHNVHIIAFDGPKTKQARIIGKGTHNVVKKNSIYIVQLALTP